MQEYARDKAFLGVSLRARLFAISFYFANKKDAAAILHATLIT